MHNTLADDNVAKYPFGFPGYSGFLRVERDDAKDAHDKCELDVWKAPPEAGGRAGRADVSHVPEVSEDNVVAADEAGGVSIGISYGLVVGLAVGVFVPILVED